jgi:helix-turn-helix protein
MTFQTKDEVNRFTRKLYRFLDDGHTVEFRHMRTLRGEIVMDVYPTKVSLDPRDNIISTLIHEALHYFYPQASETWVLRMESKIIHSLSERQIRNIIRRLAQNI